MTVRVQVEWEGTKRVAKGFYFLFCRCVAESTREEWSDQGAARSRRGGGLAVAVCEVGRWGTCPHFGSGVGQQRRLVERPKRLGQVFFVGIEIENPETDPIDECWRRTADGEPPKSGVILDIHA